MELNIFDDNRKFWQKIKHKNIVICEKDIITSENDEVAEKLNNFFIKAVENLEIEIFAPTVEKVENNTQTEIIGEIIKRYEASQHFKN